MVTLAGAIIAYLRAFFVPRHKLVLEAVALRQQLAVVKRKQAAPQTRFPRPVVLDCAPSVVGPLVRSLNHSPAGDRGFLAPCPIPAVLAVGSQRRRSGTGDGADRPLNSAHEGGRRKIPLGARPASTANCSSSASRSPRPPFPVIWRN